MKKYGLVLFSLMLLVPSAFADSRYSLVGGINYGGLDSASGSIGTISATVKGDIGFGGGILVETGMFESGVLFISKSYKSTATNGVLTTSTTSTGSVVQIPIMVRLGHGGATFGLGAFIDLASSTNYGLSAGPRFGGADGGLFLDLRFNYGLKSGNSKDVLGLVGYAFGKAGK